MVELKIRTLKKAGLKVQDFIAFSLSETLIKLAPSKNIKNNQPTIVRKKLIALKLLQYLHTKQGKV